MRTVIVFFSLMASIVVYGLNPVRSYSVLPSDFAA